MSLLKQSGTCLKGRKRESIANACRIPFLKADAEATRLWRRVAQCTHTNTEMQTCTQTYKDTNTHTYTQKRHASTSGSMPVYLPMVLFIELKTFCKQKRQPKASVEKREKCTAFYMRLFSQSLPLCHVFDERRSLRRTDKYVSVAENLC